MDPLRGSGLGPKLLAVQGIEDAELNMMQMLLNNWGKNWAIPLKPDLLCIYEYIYICIQLKILTLNPAAASGSML